jgi:hypothetical protein
MSDFKNVMKGGWHPKGKDGGKESWRGDFKGINQVVRLVRAPHETSTYIWPVGRMDGKGQEAR